MFLLNGNGQAHAWPPVSRHFEDPPKARFLTLFQLGFERILLNNKSTSPPIAVQQYD